MSPMEMDAGGVAESAEFARTSGSPSRTISSHESMPSLATSKQAAMQRRGVEVDANARHAASPRAHRRSPSAAGRVRRAERWITSSSRTAAARAERLEVLRLLRLLPMLLRLPLRRGVLVVGPTAARRRRQNEVVEVDPSPSSPGLVGGKITRCTQSMVACTGTGFQGLAIEIVPPISVRTARNAVLATGKIIFRSRSSFGTMRQSSRPLRFHAHARAASHSSRAMCARRCSPARSERRATAATTATRAGASPRRGYRFPIRL